MTAYTSRRIHFDLQLLQRTLAKTNGCIESLFFSPFTLDEFVRQLWPRLEQTGTAGGEYGEVA
jgi:hypothetical protein